MGARPSPIASKLRGKALAREKALSYADEDRRIMAAIARHVLGLVDGKQTGNP